MKKIILFLGLIGVAVGKRDIQQTILGGQDAPEGLANWQASIRFGYWQHNCGASVLNERWLLTAAHCMYSYGQYLSMLSVVVGTNHLRSGGQRYNLESYILHENYNPSTQANDLCLLKTTTPIVYNDKVQPAVMPTQETPPGSNLMLTGWGEMGTDGDIPDNLQMLNFTSIGTNECDQKYKEFYGKRGKSFPITDKQLCMTAKQGTGGCKGDSGGPIVKDLSLVGVVSVGVVPCGYGVPEVSTNVIKYVPWIKQHTGM
ncbi:chymotrypsin-1-like [Pieris napi]|uniref:chymotrypsin-1-like n=1 Tax=Pieris napi TaxID=78633 RepID=UPI001FB94CD2|nr:chymotrypsin-1-like [Pieris napi]